MRVLLLLPILVSNADGIVDCLFCDKNAPAPGAGTACDGIEYDGASGKNYCGNAGANRGGGCANGGNFGCRGCAGATSCKDYCDNNAISFPGACWNWQDCFELCCADPNGPVGGVNGWIPIKICIENNPIFDRTLEEGSSQCAPCGEVMGVLNTPDCTLRYCGDGICSAGECMSNCPEDCGPGGRGDPHFKVWTGQRYDFHGECDLVLAHSVKFGGGQGLTIHIRTTIMRDYYSYIESAALQIDKDVLEVKSHGVHYLNGHLDPEKPFNISGFPVTHTKPTNKRDSFVVNLGDNQKLSIKTNGIFVSVTFNSGLEEHFGDSVGLLGSFETGSRLARDGKSVLNDPNAFGQEWQVLRSEPKLFQEDRIPQHPQICIIPPPKSESRRRLGASGVTELQAEEACADWGEDKDDCIFDVLATGDLELAEAGAY